MSMIISLFNEYWLHVGFFWALTIACWLLSGGLEKRNGFPWRVCFSVAAFHIMGYFGMPWLTRINIQLIQWTGLPGWNGYMLVWIEHLAFVFGLLLICFEGKMSRNWFCLAAGYSLESMSYGLQEILWWATGITIADHQWMRSLAYVVCYLAAYWLIVRKVTQNIRYLDSKRTILVSMMNLFLILFIGTALESYQTEAGWLLGFFRASYCVVSMFILFGLSDINKKEAELITIRQMQDKQAEHYQIAKDMMGVLNLRLHDLKYYALKSKNEKNLNELIANIKLYDAQIQTGNRALDVILTEENLKCYQKDVRLSCMADGKAIAFMEETDIYILFGNMLDNALEAVLKLPEKDKQNITLTVIRQGCYVKVHCENYVNQLPELQDGLPMTSKADKQIHGFGVKSIRLLAEKYAGMISIMPTEDTFSIDLVFPVGQYDADHPKKTETV